MISRRLRVERGERLVHQQDLRIDRERAGEIDALAHAARKLAREIILEAGQADELQQVERAALLALARVSADLGADHGVGEDGAPRQQAVLLEDEAAVAPGPVHGAAVDAHLAGARGLQSGDDAQERRLAAARRADDRRRTRRAPMPSPMSRSASRSPKRLLKAETESFGVHAQSLVHGTSLSSSQEKPAVMAMPAAASTTTPANSSGMLKLSADWLMRRPEPGARAEQFGHHHADEAAADAELQSRRA